MFVMNLTRRCRWGALLCVCACAFALPACGGDSGSNADTTDSGHVDLAPDAGADATTADAGGDAAMADAGIDAAASTIEIAGTYDSDYDSVETISSDSWKVVASYGTTDSPIPTYDNDANFAVTQNPQDAQYSPGKFNKIVWTEPASDGSFYYCTVDFGLDTADAAAASDQTADDSDPASGGCGGSAWTKLTPQ